MTKHRAIPPAPDSPYLTPEEAAVYMRYPSAHAFRVAVHRLGIPHIKRGRRLFFTKVELDEFMAVVSDATRRSA